MHRLNLSGMSQLPPPADFIPYAQVPRSRPPVITAFMIISIVLGLLGIIANACGIVQPFSYLALRNLPTSATSPSAGTPANPFANITLPPAILSACVSLLALGLAIYLLYAGILLSRRDAAAYRHHWRYAILKCPLALLSAIASGWLQYEMQSAMFANMQATTQGPFFAAFPLAIAILSTAFSLLFSLAYPVTLLIALSRPRIRAQLENLEPPASA